MTQTSTFEGFPLPTKNFFSMPNEMINIIARITNLAELKVIIYIIRHTWGYQEYGTSKAISTDEFMHGRKRKDGSRIDDGTGLSNRSVIDGLRLGVDHGYLICESNENKTRTVKSYRLKMLSSCEDSSQDGQNSSTPSCEDSSQATYETSSQDTAHLMKNLHKAYEESSQPSKKDTLETHFVEKNKRERNSNSPNITNNPVSSGVANATASQTKSSDTLFPQEEKPVEETKKTRNTLKAKLASLENFNFDQPATIETIMQLGDLWRGSPLPVIKRADSDYQKALNSSTQLSQRLRPDGQHGYSLREIDRAYRFFKRIAPEGKPDQIADEWWKGKYVDIWAIAKNIDKALESTEPKITTLPNVTTNANGEELLNGRRVFKARPRPTATAS